MLLKKKLKNLNLKMSWENFKKDGKLKADVKF